MQIVSLLDWQDFGIEDQTDFQLHATVKILSF
jgi:hypothetical protein